MSRGPDSKLFTLGTKGSPVLMGVIVVPIVVAAIASAVEGDITMSLICCVATLVFGWIAMSRWRAVRRDEMIDAASGRSGVLDSPWQRMTLWALVFLLMAAIAAVVGETAIAVVAGGAVVAVSIAAVMARSRSHP
jgi:hypothetical protein